MGECINCEDVCGFRNIKDKRCCFHCEYKNNCPGFCLVLEDLGDDEDVALNCDYFQE